jgi:hypothetical protein
MPNALTTSSPQPGILDYRCVVCGEPFDSEEYDCDGKPDPLALSECVVCENWLHPGCVVDLEYCADCA